MGSIDIHGTGLDETLSDRVAHRVMIGADALLDGYDNRGEMLERVRDVALGTTAVVLGRAMIAIDDASARIASIRAGFGAFADAGLPVASPEQLEGFR